MSDDAAPLAAANSGTNGTCVWEFGDDGVFTIKPADGVEGTLDLHSYFLPWLKLDKSGIKKIEIEGIVHAGQSVSNMFSGFENVESIDLGRFDTSAATDMSYMFYNCKKLTSLDLSGFDTSNVTNMMQMFLDCYELTSLDLSGFDTSAVTNMHYMFYECKKLTSLDLSGFDTSKVTDMGGMFGRARSLTSIKLSGGFDTSHVVDMSDMFELDRSLKSLDVSKFDGSFVTRMRRMFDYCSSLQSLDLSSFKTPKLTYASEAFEGCSNLKSLDVRNFDASNAEVDDMLKGCGSLSKIVLGDKPFLKGKGDSVAYLPDSSTDDQGGLYTGKWVYEDDPSIALDVKTLSDSHPSAGAPAGTWVRQEKPTAYTVAFDPNGGAGSMARQSYKVDVVYELPANSFYLFAKRFAGWNTAADGSGEPYADGATVWNLADAGENATLYAQWEDDSSGKLTDGEMEVTLHGNESLTIPNLPAGTRYQVYEQTPSGWVLVKQSGESGVIEPLKNAQATFVNDYQPGKAQATIVGAKTVDGDAGKVKAGEIGRASCRERV